eukprot:TRINITY_DN13411_c0_g1_i1.p1 TRINITY_DN13411_c0_g1~~TRINITY_DN13411_c0_g1_i1.p1  ORF type:complete len:383 (-),score=75.26 TRINITY_DN13411_c0_g1_i1:846-1994(-)
MRLARLTATAAIILCSVLPLRFHECLWRCCAFSGAFSQRLVSASCCKGRSVLAGGVDARHVWRPVVKRVVLAAGFEDFTAAQLRQALKGLHIELPGDEWFVRTKKRMIEYLQAEGVAPIDVLGALNGGKGGRTGARDRNQKRKRDGDSREKKMLWDHNEATLRSVLTMVGYLEDTSGYSKRRLIRCLGDLGLNAEKVNSLVGDRKSSSKKAKKKKSPHQQRKQSYVNIEDDEFAFHDAEFAQRQHGFYDDDTEYEHPPETVFDEELWENAAEYGLRSKDTDGVLPRRKAKPPPRIIKITPEAAMKQALHEGWDASALSRKNAAQLLGLSVTVTGIVVKRPSPDEVRQLRRRMVKLWHPDRHQGSEVAARALQLAMAACDILG